MSVIELAENTVEKIPIGTTHVLPSDPLGYDQTPTYMKWGFHFVGPESGTTYLCWYNWHQGNWCKDTSFSRRGRGLSLVTVGEWQIQTYQK